MSNRFNIEFDTTAVAGLADKLAHLSAAEIEAGNIAAVNEVIYRTETKFIEGMAPINLAEAYVRSKLNVEPATESAGATAMMWSPFSRTPLGKFGPATPQAVVKAKSPLRKLKGNPALGIPIGYKQVGAIVEVKRGSPNPVGTPGKPFLMALKNGNGIGVFLAPAGGKGRSHRYGPEVYQMFSVQAKALNDNIGADLQATVIAFVDQKMKALT